MPPAIPPPLATYLESSLLSPHSQILITSVLSTPSPWLLLRFIYAQLYGVGDDSESQQLSLEKGERPEKADSIVVFGSLIRPLSLWTEMGKKMGLDFHTLLRNKKVIYVDGLVYGTSAPGKGDASLPPTTKLKGLSLDDLRHGLDSALRSISTIDSASTSTTGTSSGTQAARIPLVPAAASSALSEDAKPLIILDGLDFLLACQPSLSTISLQAFLSTLRTRSQTLVLTCNTDGPLMQTATSTNHDTGTPLERNHAHFLTSMAHQSHWVFQLRGLDTGSAKDVSGVIRVSRGGTGDEDEINTAISPRVASHDLADVEWLFQLKGDGSVRVWGRGE